MRTRVVFPTLFVLAAMSIASIDVLSPDSPPAMVGPTASTPVTAYSCPKECKGPRDKVELTCERTACVQKLRVFTTPPPALQNHKIGGGT